ncbi:MAG: PAS domain S-box protein [Smithella sp.]|nr:PAS domain S-box protein [Smithella sp.]HOU52121.1 PAS domain S-box protein [Smithella sp.]HQG66088.1 PAS domain S-box protein [Smithella sp.]HQI73488.1 PAS domain S-box protein [Smithella sp.]
MTNQTLRVLMIDDSEDDVLLIARELKKGGYHPVYERVDNAAAMKKALQDQPWDIILCDYQMPQFDAPSAITVFKEENIDIPIIIISGTIGEETAVECMRLGAHDYFMKGKLSRLCPAVARELADAKVRKQQKQTEAQKEEAIKALRRSEEKYRTILENIEDGYYEVDLAGNLTFFNDSLCKILGYSRSELMGMNNRQFTDKENAKFLFQAFNKVYRTGQSTKEFNWQIIRKDGTKRYIEASVSLLKDASDKTVGFRGIVGDITERKHQEDVIRESEEKYRLLADHMKDQVWLMDLDLNIAYISPSVERALGYSLDELRKLPLDKLLTHSSFHAATKFFSIEMPIALAAPVDYVLKRSLDLEFRCKDGHKIWGECVFSFIRDDHGKPVSLLGESRDITERKKMEEELFKSEARYRTILEDIQEGYFEADLKGNLTFFNDTLVRVSGYTRDELRGMNNRHYTDPEDLKKIKQVYRQVYMTGLPNKEFVWPIRRKDGTIRYIEGSISLLKDTSGEAIGFRGIAHDITERKKAEAALLASEERYRSLFDRSLDIVYVIDFKGNFIDANDAAFKRFGYTREELPSLNVASLMNEDQLPFVFKAIQEIIDTGYQKDLIELKLHHKDGSTIYVETKGSLITSEGKPVAIQSIARDITERKQAEARLQQTLESLKKAVGTTIQVLVSALEAKDPYTAGHQSQVARLACVIAAEMGLDQDTIEGIRLAGVIHDIGKLAVPAEILTKPTRLTELEFSLIQQHPESGYEMLKHVESPWPIAQIVYQHHERIDGTGYPRNLKGNEILLEARIMAVADVVDAMASHRPYRASLGTEAALAEIEKHKGTLYDGNVVDTCLKLFREKGYKHI